MIVSAHTYEHETSSLEAEHEVRTVLLCLMSRMVPLLGSMVSPLATPVASVKVTVPKSTKLTSEPFSSNYATGKRLYDP